MDPLCQNSHPSLCPIRLHSAKILEFKDQIYRGSWTPWIFGKKHKGERNYEEVGCLHFIFWAHLGTSHVHQYGGKVRSDHASRILIFAKDKMWSGHMYGEGDQNVRSHLSRFYTNVLKTWRKPIYVDHICTIGKNLTRQDALIGCTNHEQRGGIFEKKRTKGNIDNKFCRLSKLAMMMMVKMMMMMILIVSPSWVWERACPVLFGQRSIWSRPD